MGSREVGTMPFASDRMNFGFVQDRHRAWANKNFGEGGGANWRPLRAFLGVVEEVGELSHALLKQHQGIRGDWAEHEAKGKDAVGDVILFLTDLCNRKGWDLQQIMEDVTAEVWARDWTKNRDNGEVA